MQDPEQLKVHHVFDVVGKQGFQCSSIARLPVFVPKTDSEESIHALQVSPIKSQLLFASLEPA